MSEIRVTSVVGENGGDRVGLTTGLTVGPLTGTTGIGATITHQGHAQFAGVCTASSSTVSSGNVVIGTDGKGIDLSIQDVSAGVTTSAHAMSGSITSEIFNHYETGTFLPFLLYHETATTYSSRSGRYTRVGNLVFVQGKMVVSSMNNSDGSGFTIGGIPYTSPLQSSNGQESVLFTLGRLTSLLGSKATAVTNVRFTNKGANAENFTGGLQLMEGNDSKITYNECASSGTLEFAAQYMVIEY